MSGMPSVVSIPKGNAVKDFCSRIRENSDDPMTLQKSYDFCYVRLGLFCSSEILNGVARRDVSH